MTDDDKARFEALDALLGSRGYAIWRDYVKAEWASGACWRKAIEEADGSTDKDALTAAILKVKYTNEQLGALMDWPQQEHARLKRQLQPPAEPSMSRGGYR